MFKRGKCLTVMAVILTVILILAYAIILLLPCSHECVEADCSICAIIETSCKILIGIILSASFGQLTKKLFTFLHTHAGCLLAFDSTPVGLKVKLSE